MFGVGWLTAAACVGVYFASIMMAKRLRAYAPIVSLNRAA
jgi:hypothetical protein